MDREPRKGREIATGQEVKIHCLAVLIGAGMWTRRWTETAKDMVAETGKENEAEIGTGGGTEAGSENWTIPVSLQLEDGPKKAWRGRITRTGRGSLQVLMRCLRSLFSEVPQTKAGPLVILLKREVWPEVHVFE